MMAVWELDQLLNEFRTLHLADVVAGREEGSLDFAYSFHGDKPLSATWTPPRVVYLESEKAKGDFPYFWGARCPVFTRRSLDALRDLVAPFGEFLPLSSTEGEFTAFKVLHFIDALDTERSEIDWFPQLKRELAQPKRVRRIKRFVLDEDRLRGAVIFRMPQLPLGEVFVTEVLADRIKEAGLRGFWLKQVRAFPDAASGMPQASTGHWKSRVLDRAKRLGYPSVLAVFQANPAIPFGQVFRLFRETESGDDIRIAYIQLQAVYFEEAEQAGILREAVADCFVRKLREHLRGGWNKGKHVRQRQAAVMSLLEFPTTSITGVSLYGMPIWEILQELKPPDEWCPEDSNDPIVREVFRRAWPQDLG